jgi:hypothetical protein
MTRTSNQPGSRGREGKAGKRRCNQKAGVDTYLGTVGWMEDQDRIDQFELQSQYIVLRHGSAEKEAAKGVTE